MVSKHKRGNQIKKGYSSNSGAGDAGTEDRKTGKMIWMKILTGILLFIILAGALYYANYDRPRYTITETSGTEYETAKVLAVLKDKTVIDESTENMVRGSLELEIEILTGRYKGDVVQITDYISPMYQVVVGEGDRLSVRIDTSDVETYSVSVYNHDRIFLMCGLVCCFFVLLILIGGKQGVKAILGLLLTFAGVIFLLIPLVLKGFPAILTTLVILAVTTIGSFYLIAGTQKKSLAAMASTIGGVCAAAVFAAAAGKLAHLTTYQMDEAEALMLVSTDNEFQMKNLFICGVLIASVGAVMDVAMSISSAIEELHVQKPQLTVKQLFRSGMVIGRDAMGTMANTLILAYAGSSLNMMLLIYSYGVSFVQLINTDFVAVELIQSIAGSIGIVLTVPLSAYIGAWIVKK